ncbi:MAG: hypothetical protein J5589_02010 [Firmicutes bacterium]|nr:hypothetical protein [Bacillota bacterium]
MYFFTSDLHFGDNDIIAREARPFPDIQAFAEAFIQNVNAVAKPEDTLIVIGDYYNYNWGYKPDPLIALDVNRHLLPRVVLILGNGEQRMVREMFDDDLEKFRAHCAEYGFADILPDLFLNFGGREFYLNHYPRNHKDGYVNLFGHTHRGTGLWKPYGLNVGIDLNCFRPFSEKDILELVETKEQWWDTDPDCLSM